MDATNQDYLKIREALFQDSSRDQRIHHWIASQYDFALSEFEAEGCIPASRADSPLLGFPDNVATTTSDLSHEEAPCPSYEPLFYSPSQDNLSTADLEFEESERERALKFLIQEMNLGRVFPCTGGAQHHVKNPERDISASREKVSIFCKIYLDFTSC